MQFLGGRLPKAQYDDPDKILEQEELDDEMMSDFMQGGRGGATGNQSNRSGGSIPKNTKHSMLSAKISPSNSLAGITRGQDPTNRSVIEENFKDDDSIHKMNHRRHKSKQQQNLKEIEKPRVVHDPELDQISSIQMNQMQQESTKDSTVDNIIDG